MMEIICSGDLVTQEIFSVDVFHAGRIQGNGKGGAGWLPPPLVY